MVKRFQRTNQVSFSSHWLWPGYWYIIWNINTTNRHMGTIFRIWSVLAQIQPSSDPRVKQVSNTVINIGLVIMSLDSGLTVGGNFVFFIVFVILIRLGRAYRLGWVIFKLSHTKGWDYFCGASWPLKTPCKEFHLVKIVGGLGWMKWLKNAVVKCLYFMQLFLHCIPSGEISIG